MGGVALIFAVVLGILYMVRSQQRAYAIDTDFRVPGFETFATRTDGSRTAVPFPDDSVRSFELVVQGSLSEVLPIAERELRYRGYAKTASPVKGWACFDGKRYKRACVILGNKLDQKDKYDARYTTIFFARRGWRQVDVVK